MMTDVGDDAQERSDELEALQAIFPLGSVRVKAERQWVIFVSVDLDAEVELLPGSGLKVSKLPPAQLSVALPSDYPSVSRPLFSLECTWLDVGECAAALGEIDRVAEELQGMAVIFACCDRLRELCTERTSLTVAEDVAMELVAYDAWAFKERFVEGSHTCPVCFEDLAGSSFLLLSCRHFVCLDCMASLCKVHIKDGSVELLRCTSPGCVTEIPVPVLRSLVDPAAFARWEKLLLARTIDQMPDLVHCPRCSTPTLEDVDQHCAQCPKCSYAFCGLCLEAWHGGTKCLDPEATLRVLEARRRGGAVSAAALAKEKDLAQQVESMRLLKRESKQCPRCRMGISKNEGCNKMHCSYCDCSFCWLCGEDITEASYSHFRLDSGTACSGLLFEGMVREGVIVRYDGYEVDVGAAGAHPPPGAARPPQQQSAFCPVCGQDNWRMGGNNHMRCWSCETHFCFLCRATIRKSKLHFKRGGRCKQHGDS